MFIFIYIIYPYSDYPETVHQNVPVLKYSFTVPQREWSLEWNLKLWSSWRAVIDSKDGSNWRGLVSNEVKGLHGVWLWRNIWNS